MRRTACVVPLWWLSALIPAAAAQTPAPSPKPAEPLRTAEDRPIDITHIRLDLSVDLDGQEVAGRAAVSLTALRAVRAIRLDAVGFEVSAVRLQPKDVAAAPVAFSHDGRVLTVEPPEGLAAGAPAVVLIDYRVRQPKAGLHFFKPTPAEPDVPHQVWSQGEPATNRHWIPCVDSPAERQTTELVVTVAAGYEVLSNGRLLSRKENPADKTVTFHWRQDQPHVSYLVTLVVGKFAVVAKEWRGRPVTFWVPPDRKADVERTFGRTVEMLDFFSARFGVDYPWDQYAQVVVEQFTAGGMENTSATTLTDRSLHDARAFLDSSPDGLIAHELGHQWWGDLVTCRDWAHLWLNEGFASYCEVLWAEHKLGADEAALNLLGKARAAIAGGKDRPVMDRRWTSPGAMFDARAYPKGAWVLHMLRKRLGEDAFWRGVRRWATDHKLRSVETHDLRRTLEDETGRSLERFFFDWLERPGAPELSIETEWLPESRLARVTVKQTQPGEPFAVPLHVEFAVAGQSAPVTLREEITDKETRFLVPLPSRPVSVRVDPDQTVLAEIRETKSRELWLAQLTGDPSPVLRIRAAEHFGQSRSAADREALAKALSAERFWAVAAEIAAALGESGGDASRDALLAGLRHDHPKVRRAVADALGRFPRDPAVAAALRAVLGKGDASYFVEAEAAESYGKVRADDAVSVLTPLLDRPSHNEVIRSAALTGLAETGDPGVIATLAGWTRRGRPRTCRLAALRALERLAAVGNLTDEQRFAAAAPVIACLDGEPPPVKRAAVDALRGMGRSAAAALPTLEALARHDPDDRVREAASKAREKLRSDAPAPVELSRLREELDRLRKVNEALTERLERFEKMERK